MKSSPGRLLIVVLLVALGLRLLAGLWWQSRTAGRFVFGDSEAYWELGRSVARGAPYEYGRAEARVFRMPGYPLLLAPIFCFAGDDASPLWGRALSAGLDTLSVAGVAWMGSRLFGTAAGLLAAAIAAVYPGSIAVGATVLSEAPFCSCMLLNLGLWIAAWETPRGARAGGLALLSGMAAGLATLMRPGWLLFVPFAIGLGVVLGKPRARHLALGGALMAGLVLAMAPWWIRNARVTNRFVPTTLQFGATLYDGWNPWADGGSEMSYGDRIAGEEGQRLADAGVPRGEFEYRIDRRLRDEALAWAREHPWRVAQLAAIKFVRLWNVWPNERSMSTWPVRIAVAATYIPILILGLVGAVGTTRRGWPYVLCWLPAVYLTLLHVVFVSSIRYRQPAMLLWIVLASGVVAHRFPGTRPKESISPADPRCTESIAGKEQAERA